MVNVISHRPVMTGFGGKGFYADNGTLAHDVAGDGRLEVISGGGKESERDINQY